MFDSVLHYRRRAAAVLQDVEGLEHDEEEAAPRVDGVDDEQPQHLVVAGVVGDEVQGAVDLRPHAVHVGLFNRN